MGIAVENIAVKVLSTHEQEYLFHGAKSAPEGVREALRAVLESYGLLTDRIISIEVDGATYGLDWARKIVDEGF